MGRKFHSTGTVVLTNSGDTTILTAPLPVADSLGTPQEHFITRLYIERTDVATPVTITLKNTEDTPRVLLPAITFNNDQGKLWMGWDEPMDLGVGQNRGLVVNASVGNKATIYVEYRIGDNVDWPT